MQVIQRIINQGHGYLDADYLVIHSTANTGATALNHVSYWSNNPGVPMAHYVGDWTGYVYHTVPDDRICWHVGNANGFTIGIELCEPAKYTDFEKVWRMGVEFAARYLASRGWGTDRLLSHNDCRIRWGGTDHTDPLPFFGRYGRTWDQFKTDVETEMLMAEIDYDRLGDAVARKLMDYEIKNPDSDFKADVKWRIFNLGNKTQTMQDTLLRIEKKLDE